MSNPFKESNAGLVGISGKPLKPSEWTVGVPFTNACRYFHVAVAGDITFARACDDEPVTYPNVQPGPLLVGATQIIATTVPSPTTNIIPHE